MPLCADDIQVGRLYRGKRRKQIGDDWDDRVVVWISADRTRVQYDSYAVANGRKLPRTDMDKFLRWAAAQVVNT